MSYIYSNGLCHEALRLISSDDNFESRLVRAFSEMGVSRYGDTSDEIWNEWKELEKKYHATSGEIYQQRKIGTVSEELSTELKQLGQALVALICDWMEFNTSKISQGKLKPASTN
jgi:hypothetical protein